MKPEIMETLSAIPLFNNIPTSTLELMAQSFHHALLSAHQCILSGGQRCGSVYFLLRGTVKVCLEEADGSDVILAICGSGEILGEISALDGAGHSASVITLEPSEMVWIERERFCQYLNEVPALASNLAALLAKRLRRATTQTRALAHLDIHGRIASQLIAFARDYGKTTQDGSLTIPLCLSQSDLACLVGSTRESVNRVLSSYRQSGYISLKDHHIAICNLPALQHLAQ